MRNVHRELEYQFGHGLVGLIHPVTQEFNHEAVIRRRGGRHAHERLGNAHELGITKVLSAIHNLVGAGENKWMYIGESTYIDRYDAQSFYYGWIISLIDIKSEDQIASNYCF